MNLSLIGNPFGKLLKATVSKTAGGTCLAIASLLIVFGFGHEALAVTTYELPAPLSEQVVDFPNSGSGVAMRPLYDFAYRIPEGITFDRIQMSVPSAQGTYSRTPYWAIFNNVDDWFYTSGCINATCISNDSQAFTLTQTSHSEPTDGVLQWVFSTSTTITTSAQYFRMLLDPNPPYVDFSYNATTFSTGASLNGGNYTITNQVPTIKFCNGACDDNNFSPIPNLTATAWGRLISPASGSDVEAGTTQTLNFQVNTGTTTADNVQVRFASTLQSLAPYDYTITSTGLSSFNYNLSLPAISDYIQMVVDVRSGTTSLYVSPTYSLNVRVAGSGVVVNPQEAQSCDELSGLSWAICSTVAFLFVPSEASINSFFGNYEELKGTIPFVYVFQATDMLTSIYDGTGSTLPTVSVVTGIGTITFISEAQLAAIPYVVLLRSLIAAGLWIMLFVVLYRKTITIHDKQATT